MSSVSTATQTDQGASLPLRGGPAALGSFYISSLIWGAGGTRPPARSLPEEEEEEAETGTATMAFDKWGGRVGRG